MDQQAFSMGLIVAHICVLAIVAWWYFDPRTGGHLILRLKENVKRTGVSESGIPIYTFNYKNDNNLWSGSHGTRFIKYGYK